MAGSSAVRLVALAAVLTAAAIAVGCGTSSSNYSCGAECDVSINGTQAVALDTIGATVSVPETGDGTATFDVSGASGQGTVELSVGEQGEAAGYEVLLEAVDGDEVDFKIRPAQ